MSQTNPLARLEAAHRMLAEARTVGVWCQMPYSNRGALPTTPGVYVIFDGDHVFYVGSAANLRARWKSSSHHRAHQVAHEPLAILGYFSTSSAVEAREVERWLIAAVKPRWNQTPIHCRQGALMPDEQAAFDRRFATHMRQRLADPRSPWASLAALADEMRARGFRAEQTVEEFYRTLVA